MGTDPQRHQVYRDRGNTLTVTLITLSGGLLLWTTSLFSSAKEENILIYFIIFFSVLCIVFSLLGMNTHYKGYMLEARSETIPNKEANDEFKKADWQIPAALYTFFVAGLLGIILLIMMKI